MVAILEKMNRLVPGKNISLKDDKLEILKLKKNSFRQLSTIY